MKLQSAAPTSLLAITAYDATGISVGARKLSRSFILTPQRLIEDWSPVSLDALCAEDLDILAGLNHSIVLLGTGLRQRFPAPALLRPLIERHIGVEVMDSFAACRTYNILMAEGREVAAAIIVEAA
ncbi:MAG: hypothetical protein EPO47_07585 [Rugosibacter sp.]|nr:MAG: hypothetical protein EPO60_01425 [Rugosibacter sp.]TBR08951.1 MAG: hypothetical protein EPO47_07585 [Rugosibacter sp.]